MKKARTLLLLLFVFPFISYAQGHYGIKADVKQLRDGTKIFLIYDVDGIAVTDSTFSKSGSFFFSGSIDYPVSATLYLHKNPYVNKPSPKEQIDFLRFYLEPVEMDMRATDSLKKIEIMGSQINIDQDTFRKMRESIDNKFTALNNEFYALEADQQKDPNVRTGFIDREESLMDELYSVHLAFARQHPSSYLSLIYLSFVAGREKFADEVAQVFSGLSTDLKKYPVAEEIPIQLESITHTKIGEKAPDIELQTPEGKYVKISDFKGKYLLVDFWASWCGPCREENPNLVALYHTYKNSGFEILGISLDRAAQRDRWIKAIADDGLHWPQISDLKGWDSRAAKHYGVNSIPTSFLLDPEGNILDRDLRGSGLEDRLRAIFQTKGKHDPVVAK